MSNNALYVKDRIFFDCARSKKIEGGGYCLWSDNPAAETEEEILENMKPYLRACSNALQGKTKQAKETAHEISD